MKKVSLRSGVIRAAATIVALTLAGCTSGRAPDRGEAVPTGWPLARERATVSAAFGASRGSGRHEGLDLAAPKGTPVSATASGTVLRAGREGRYGRTVVIDHGDGWQTRYAHLRRVRVDTGESVRRGDIVGTVGRSGNATGYHLHYEVRRQGVPIDPGPTLGR